MGAGLAPGRRLQPRGEGETPRAPECGAGGTRLGLRPGAAAPAYPRAPFSRCSRDGVFFSADVSEEIASLGSGRSGTVRACVFQKRRVAAANGAGRAVSAWQRPDSRATPACAPRRVSVCPALGRGVGRSHRPCEREPASCPSRRRPVPGRGAGRPVPRERTPLPDLPDASWCSVAPPLTGHCNLIVLGAPPPPGGLRVSESLVASTRKPVRKMLFWAFPS